MHHSSHPLGLIGNGGDGGGRGGDGGGEGGGECAFRQIVELQWRISCRFSHDKDSSAHTWRWTQSHALHSSILTVSGLHHVSHPSHGTPIPWPGRAQSLARGMIAKRKSIEVWTGRWPAVADGVVGTSDPRPLRLTTSIYLAGTHRPSPTRLTITRPTSIQLTQRKNKEQAHTRTHTRTRTKQLRHTSSLSAIISRSRPSTAPPSRPRRAGSTSCRPLRGRWP